MDFLHTRCRRNHRPARATATAICWGIGRVGRDASEQGRQAPMEKVYALQMFGRTNGRRRGNHRVHECQ